MTNKQSFIDFIQKNVNIDEMPEEAKNYWNSLTVVKEKEKPPFTENGKMILEYMKDNYQTNELFSSKDIADGLMVTSRTVSGAIRKLITDGYVEKASVEPVTYRLTEKGIEVVI